MQIVQDEVVSGKTVTIDEKHFVNCRYKNCTVIYSGGDYGWTNTTFENCQMTLAGAAQRTAALLGNFGLIPPSGGTVPVGGQSPKKSNGGVQ